jgi:hypothetical protein
MNVASGGRFKLQRFSANLNRNRPAPPSVVAGENAGISFSLEVAGFLHKPGTRRLPCLTVYGI